MPLYKVLRPPVTVRDDSQPRGTREVWEGTLEMSESQAAPLVALGAISLGVTEDPSPQNAEMGTAPEQPARFIPLPGATEEQIEPDQTSGKADETPPSLVNVNSASKEDLVALPNIGPALADRILKARQAKPFESMEELDQILELPPTKFGQIAPLISL